MVELRILVVSIGAFSNTAIFLQHVGLVAGQTFVAGLTGRTLGVTRQAEAILFEVAYWALKHARGAFVTF